MSILQVENLKKTYTTRFGGNLVQALSNVSFTVEEGEYVAIMGESGSGKTTLLNILATLDKPTSGRVLLDGQDTGHIHAGQLAVSKIDARKPDRTVCTGFRTFNFRTEVQADRDVLKQFIRSKLTNLHEYHALSVFLIGYCLAAAAVAVKEHPVILRVDDAILNIIFGHRRFCSCVFNRHFACEIVIHIMTIFLGRGGHIISV